MSEFNFFESYEEKKEPVNIMRIVLAVIMLGILGAIILFIGYFTVSNTSLKSEISSIQNVMQDPIFVQEVEEARKVKQEKMLITEEKGFFDTLEETMKRTHRVNEEFMQFMQSQVVQELFLDELVITDTNISLEGRAKTKLSIAQFESDLRESGRFSSILVSTITKSEGVEGDVYTFAMEISIKEDVDNEQ